jgi:hypothetical protein
MTTVTKRRARGPIVLKRRPIFFGMIWHKTFKFLLTSQTLLRQRQYSFFTSVVIMLVSTVADNFRPSVVGQTVRHESLHKILTRL